MNASKKNLTAAERAAKLIAESDQELGTASPPRHVRTDDSRTASPSEGARGVIGRLDLVLGPGRRAERVEIDPARVRVWQLQGRLQDALGPAQVEDLVASMREFSQFQPAIVRPIRDGGHFTHEVIDGSRRRLACEFLQRQLVAVSRDMTDLEAAMVAQASDDQVKHSAYEEALRWQGWIEAGLAASSNELADKVRVSRGHMSQRLRLAQVPRDFLRCWGDHDRVPRPIYLRLATLISKAKQTDRLDVVRENLQSEGLRLIDTGKGDKEALQVLKKLETDLRPTRQRTVQPVERLGEEKGRILTVHPGRYNIGIKFEKALTAERQNDFAAAVADFAVGWLAKCSRRE